MQQLKVIGPFKGWSGYDRTTREFVRQFVRLGLRVQLTPLANWSVDLPIDWREGDFFDGLAAPVQTDTVLHFAPPHMARPELGMRNINYTMFEADRIPRDWVARASSYECIIVPTEASRLAWVESGVSAERLRVSPHGVDGTFFAQVVAPLDLTTVQQRSVSSYTTRFLNIAELRPRKNHLGLLRSWIRATQADDDAVLILKLTFFQAYMLAQFQADLAEMQARLGRTLADAAPIVLVVDVLTEQQLCALYHTATHYISFSKGEGWDQVMMEAAAAGLQLIAPRHSAYLYNLRDAEATWIPVIHTPARFEGRLGREDSIFFNDLGWWEPDEDAAVEVIRRTIRAGSSLATPSPQNRIVSEYAWERVGQQLVNLL